MHGAFADASSWNGMVERLQAEGVRVTAPVNPLRGISHDSAYIASLIDQTPGPVIAVGHSYGGAVITNAAANADNVVGLIYVAAFAPDEGETLGEGEIESDSKDSVLNTAEMPLKYPTGEGQETAVEFCNLAVGVPHRSVSVATTTTGSSGRVEAVAAKTSAAWLELAS